MTISERIRAVHTLQRFVMMSRTLLPKFTELMAKNKRSKDEERKVQRIRDVYESFEAKPEISELLVNSNIFQLIKDVYKTCVLSEGHTPQSFYTYDAFLEESDRLIDDWNRQILN
jgi:hypothetical protein